jgi:hypothetical protein
MTNSITKTIKIADIDQMLIDGYDIEVTSPDGWVPVTAFVDKGMWDEYALMLTNGKVIRVNENHLFETIDGWQYAKDLVLKKQQYLTEDGYLFGIITKTGKQIPIVDITVDHVNHRYYTDGVSSHNTGCGKSLGMCHMASASLSQGRNVLYITLEMAEEKIAERIDANLFDTRIDQLINLSKDSFNSKVKKISEKTHGKLIIKEYPTAAAHCGHFRALLNELKLKKNFVPDIIYIDYLNICASSRMKGLSGSINTYSLIKSIAEEIRGLAVEFNVPIWSATQVTRAGFSSSDVEITDTSESFGLPATADLMLAFIRTEQLDKMNQIMVKQLKNRYNDPTTNKRFAIGVDLAKMRLYDIADPMANISGDSSSPPPVATTPFSAGTKAKQNFSGFKV